MNQISLADVRAKYPQYENRSDEELAGALHQKYYSQVPQEEFFQAIGLQTQEPSIMDKAAGVGEAALTMGSAIVAEPLAGLSGIVQAANPFGEKGSAAEVVESVRENLTYSPRTQEGQENLQAVGDVLEPVAEVMESAEQGLGDAVFEKTGSPALAAAATTIPTLATEVLGVAIGKGATKAVQGLKKSRESGMIARSLDDALPTREQLFDLGGALYKEVDEAGAAVKGRSYTDLVNKIEKQAMKGGLNKTLSPQANAVIKEMRALSDVDVPVSQIDTFRKMAGGAAGSADNLDASLGMMIRSELDDFLDNANMRTMRYGGDDPTLIGKKLKTARDLWGRARKSELIEEAMSKAELTASGFENGIRQEFRRLLNNKGTKKLFTPGEKSAMRAVVQGDSNSNVAKLIGRFGFSEGGATNIVGGSIGATLGGVTGGAGTAVAIPFIGQVSRNFAQKLTKGNALFADKVIRAGSDADKITKAYFKFTPKAERSADELAQLLMKKNIDFSSIPKDEIAKEAARIAQQKQAAISSLGGVTAAQGVKEIEEQ